MLFTHSPQLLDQFPQLSVTTLSVTSVTAAHRVGEQPAAVGPDYWASLANGSTLWT
jgi:hypothetical protein